MNVEIKKLNPGLAEDFLYFFDNVAFTDNPEWSCCYCYFYHSDCSDEEWMKRTCEENRNSSKQLILTNRMNGYLAYVDDKPVGWCHSDNKSKLIGLKHHLKEAVNNEDKEKIGAIVCFVIAPEFRKQGIASKLLQYSCDEFRRHGYSYIEAYPQKECSSDSGNYHGPLKMYLSAGFKIYKELSDKYIVRKEV